MTSRCSFSPEHESCITHICDRDTGLCCLTDIESKLFDLIQDPNNYTYAWQVGNLLGDQINNYGKSCRFFLSVSLWVTRSRVRFNDVSNSFNDLC